MYRVMFSITTIASSTTNPVEMVSAINDRLSRLKPNRYMTPNVPISETGTAMLGINVFAGCAGRETPPGSPASTEMISVLSTSWTEARMVTVWSMATRSLIDCGMDACKDAAGARGSDPPYR